MVKGKVHAKFSANPSSSLGGEWRETNRQTDTQTNRHTFCFICIDGIIVWYIRLKCMFKVGKNEAIFVNYFRHLPL